MESKILRVEDLPIEVSTRMRMAIRSDKQYKKLAEKKAILIRSHRIAEAMEISALLKEIENKVINQYLAEYQGQKVQMESLFDGMCEEDKSELNVKTNAIIFLADLIESMVMDCNQILHRSHPDYTIEMFDKIGELGKECHAQMKFMADSTTMDFQTTFADEADKLEDMFMKRAAIFTRKVERLKAKKLKSDKLKTK